MTRRCAICFGRGPQYLLVERETGYREAFCVGCLRDTVRLLSHARDLARCLGAQQSALRVEAWVGAAPLAEG